MIGLNFNILLIWKALSTMHRRVASSATGVMSYSEDNVNYSKLIYSKLIAAYWRAKNSSKKFAIRPQETFSLILRGTVNDNTITELLNRVLQCQHPKKNKLLLSFVFIFLALKAKSSEFCTSDNLTALFAHIFDGADLEVDKSDAEKFQSAIDRVATDFANEPEAGSEALTGSPLRHGGRGGAAACSGHSAHRSSPDASNSEFEAMMRAASSAAEKQAAMMKWLAESKQ